MRPEGSRTQTWVSLILEPFVWTHGTSYKEDGSSSVRIQRATKLPKAFLFFFLEGKTQKEPHNTCYCHSRISLTQPWPEDTQVQRIGISSLHSVFMVPFYNLIMKQTNKKKQTNQKNVRREFGEKDTASTEEFTDPLEIWAISKEVGHWLSLLKAEKSSQAMVKERA